MAKEQRIALALWKLRDSLTRNHALCDGRLVAGAIGSKLLFTEPMRVVRGVDHATGNPSFERSSTIEAAATLDRPREPLVQSIVRTIGIAGPCQRQPKKRGTASPVDLFDRYD